MSKNYGQLNIFAIPAGYSSCTTAEKKCLHYNDVKIKKPMDSLPQIFFFPFGIKYRQLQMATL